LFKKVELNEQKLDKVEKPIKNMEEMMKKITINSKFVEEEIVIDVQYVEKDIENMMMINSGAPVSLVSSDWFKQYVKEAKIDDEEIKKSSSAWRFRLGKTLYISEQKVQFPVVLKTDRDDFIKREVIANVIDSEEVTFLCGEQTLLESIGSSGQIEEKALRQSVASLKQMLEDGEINSYSWIAGTEIVADVFTKFTESLDEILLENVFRHAQTQENLVIYEDEEIWIRNLVTKKAVESWSL